MCERGERREGSEDCRVELRYTVMTEVESAKCRRPGPGIDRLEREIREGVPREIES